MPALKLARPGPGSVSARQQALGGPLVRRRHCVCRVVEKTMEYDRDEEVQQARKVNVRVYFRILWMYVEFSVDLCVYVGKLWRSFGCR